MAETRFLGIPRAEGRGTSGLCGLRAAGEHLSERYNDEDGIVDLGKYVNDVAEPRRTNADYPLSRSRTEEYACFIFESDCAVFAASGV
jgi:hypothetical protein